MEEALVTKFERLRTRLQEVNQLLSDPSAADERDTYKKITQEYAELTRLINAFESYQEIERELTDFDSLADDPQLAEMISEERPALLKKQEDLFKKLQLLLVPEDPYDSGNIFLEIRAGTGGQESALFAADLFRMYTRYAERQNWDAEIVSCSESELGGYKEIIVRLIGHAAYSRLKFESGGHRVQRIPVTETQGRIHTSACTVAVMPEVQKVEEVLLNPSDLRIDTFRASGAGGQHVNRTDSAVRVTHLPTGIVAECQDERSQHKNKARALSVLAARILDKQRQAQNAQEAAKRKSLVGSGDRSERIRTYNFPQGRVTDHRINLTLYKLEYFLDGDLSDMLEALSGQHQQEQLERMYQQYE